MATHSLFLLPGDGIGTEIMAEVEKLIAWTNSEQLKLLLDDAERGSNATLTVDLEAQTVQGPDGGTIHFDIDPSRKQILLEGLDDIAGTLKSDPSISAFEGKMASERPWL